MTAHAPQHLRQRPPRLTPARSSLQVRRGTVLATGTALAVPTSLGAAVIAAPADAATVTAPTIAPKAQPAAMPARPSTSVVVLHYGSRGDLVKTAQRRLGVRVDGNFGPQTLSSVKAFQSRKHLKVDGYVGPATWRALGGFPSGTDDPPSSHGCTSYVVRYGSKGDVVKAAQAKVGVRADGDFGANTLTAVKAFQKRKGLHVDGIVGPTTWRSLGGYPCGEEPPSGSDGVVTGTDVLEVAKRYIGMPYVWGGDTPAESFDCSGLTQYVYRQLGIHIPRTSIEQSRFRTGVDRDHLKVGDLVFFYSPVHHVGIYAGNGRLIDAARPGTDISIHKMHVAPVKAIRLV
ncbi:peptidoglycan-binding protein [Luteipulveratus mongoliensis]|uniref:C40 family peptidase n=1 Tax=Luteipulveratus mongoliensis TaxID=571913 RepID=UPI0006981132|nr:peptidoglycan-binding protein [Luteipulveratus mongoliensis]